MVAGSLLRQQLRARQTSAVRNLAAQNLYGSRTQLRRLASSQVAQKGSPVTPKTASTPETETPQAASSSSSASNPTTNPTSSSSSRPNAPSTPTVPGNVGSTREPTWLTKQLQASPTAMKVFLALTRAMGYGSPKQVAGQRVFAIYEDVCAVRPDEDKEFWQNGTCLSVC